MNEILSEEGVESIYEAGARASVKGIGVLRRSHEALRKERDDVILAFRSIGEAEQA